MPTFEQCANCGELRIEHYGAVTEDKCVACAATERRALVKRSATVSPSPRQDDSIALDDLFKPEKRRHVRIKTALSGQIEDRNSPHEFTILDVSKSGAKLQTTHNLPDGPLTLDFPSAGTLHAMSAWRNGGEGGVTFIESPAEVAAVIGKASPSLQPMLRAA